MDGSLIDPLLGPEPPPPTLWHYTTANGLLGIISSSCVWASDYRFLNDSQEFSYGRVLINHVLDNLTNPAASPEHALHDVSEEFDRVFVSYREAVREMLNQGRMPIYVACFCEEGDLLSQWRGYGADHGYALELDTGQLALADATSPATSGSTTLAKVLYGAESASRVADAIASAMAEDSNLGHWGVHAHYMAVRASKLLVTVKHPGFAEEREWRLVQLIEADDLDDPLFRPSSMAVVPYRAVQLPLQAIRSVRVGPGRHAETRAEGVRRLLAAHNLDAAVMISELPLRA